MEKKIGFDHILYDDVQTKAILDRVAQFDRLYLEIGGKLLEDKHAERVLPGYHADAKVQVMQRLADQLEVIVCIHAHDIDHKHVNGGLGITYGIATLRLIERLQGMGIVVNQVVITRCNDVAEVRHYHDQLRAMHLTVTIHRSIPGYPHKIAQVLSSTGFGQNAYVITHRPIVAVIAPGPGSGKLATCLNQLYHEHQVGQRTGYAKLESFPVWNMPLDHPLNMAYEAATADLHDYNMVDPFHYQAYGQLCTNYNRDVEAFPVLQALLKKLMGTSCYESPTDMGVNRIKDAIINDDVVQDAAKQEIIARYFHVSYEHHRGMVEYASVKHVQDLMQQLSLVETDRVPVVLARQVSQQAYQAGKGEDGVFCGVALQLHDGTMVTGKSSPQLHALSAAVLNAIKILSGIADDVHLLPESILHSIKTMKNDIFGSKNLSLNLEEVLIALSVASVSDDIVAKAMQSLKQLKGIAGHSSQTPSGGDIVAMSNLGLSLTYDSQWQFDDGIY